MKIIYDGVHEMSQAAVAKFEVCFCPWRSYPAEVRGAKCFDVVLNVSSERHPSANSQTDLALWYAGDIQERLSTLKTFPDQSMADRFPGSGQALWMHR